MSTQKRIYKGPQNFHKAKKYSRKIKINWKPFTVKNTFQKHNLLIIECECDETQQIFKFKKLRQKKNSEFYGDFMVREIAKDKTQNIYTHYV